MYRLGLRHGVVATMPYLSLLTEHNVRKGFFELDQFRAILKHLPTGYHALFEIAYITGWRIRSELLTRQWRHVDFSDRGWLRLEPGEAKDATAGREFQFTTWMREVLGLLSFRPLVPTWNHPQPLPIVSQLSAEGTDDRKH